MLSGGAPRRMRGEAGVVGPILVVVLAFALFAVVQLTRTTLAAQRIDGHVDKIVVDVGPGSSGVSHLDEVARLDETVRIAGEISAAAKPLSAQLDQVISSAAGIDDTASLIHDTVVTINRTVSEIGTTVAGAEGIHARFVDLRPVVRSINDGVEGINGRADRIIALAAAIKADTGNVLTQVGHIDRHANSIDCSVLVNGQGCR
ncbi:MAG: hypothetical protein ACRD0U_01020 [Acidimicrobiales bacterium]